MRGRNSWKSIFGPGWFGCGVTFLLALLSFTDALEAQIDTYGRSGRVSPFRGGQTTYMFQWDIPPEAYLQKNWLDQPQAFGSFFGLRTRALDEGFTFAGTYTSTVVGCVSGGKSRGVAYQDEVFLSTMIDLGKLWGLEGWSILVGMRGTDGSFIGDIVGTTPISNPVPAANRSYRMGELSLSWEGFDETLQLMAGRLVLNNVFARIPQAALFLNASMSGYPGSLSTDITFTGTNTARWGAMGRYQPVPYAYLLAGTFSANANLEVNKAHGFDFSLPPRSGTVTVTELGLYTGSYATVSGAKEEPATGPATWFGGMPGSYKVGGLVSTRPFDNYETGGEAWGDWGMYATVEQMVYSEPGGAANQEGLTLFGSVTYFDPQRSQVPWFFSTGVFYQGLLPGRPKDQCGAAFSCAFFSEDMRKLEQSEGDLGQTNEMVLEFAYSISITPWAYVTPDLQVLINPGATGKYPTAVTIGFETGITF